ncbi:regulatory-associated protein of mTOR [Culex quinquefasciatus]|uniref:regulatory-associated protein of mTOR n=1 Tax=Culex quinquefasciatus TaxID=7176 RepID=UPI0018E2E198|nr:regulatory-associated protein of mTOR [Culex quinquefasciatus]
MVIDIIRASELLARTGHIILPDKPSVPHRLEAVVRGDPNPSKIVQAVLVLNFKHFRQTTVVAGGHVCWVKNENEVDGALQQQYTEVNLNLRKKTLKNPMPEELRRVCSGLHKKIANDRVLLHFVSRGLPEPSDVGRFATGRRARTVSVEDIHRWVGSKVLLVLDFSRAGLMIETLGDGRKLREDTIIMAACRKDEELKACPNGPADLFTSCLTTPLKMALRYHLIKSGPMLGMSDERLVDVPGRLSQRPTMKGELNWILTAILDAIAWDSFDSETFGRFYRQDAVMASLFRNFLLADRVMPLFGAHPMTFPALKTCAYHHIWQHWDYVLDMAFTQRQDQLQFGSPAQPFPFFEQQMKAFEVWLSGGVVSHPQQLPIILQTLLSPSYRMRALDLLAKFTADVPNAVDMFLQLDMFPYLVKIIKTGFKRFASPLLKICTNVLAVDLGCRELLQIDRTWPHFQKTFDTSDLKMIASDEDRANALFILARLLQGHPEAQRIAREQGFVKVCMNLLLAAPKIRQWSLLCLGCFWDDNVEGKMHADSAQAHELVLKALDDDVAEVRAAAVWAMSTFVTADFDWSIRMTWKIAAEINSTVRKLYLVAIQQVVLHKLAEIRKLFENQAMQVSSPILRFLNILRKDPNPFIIKMAQAVVDFAKSEPQPEHLPLSSYSSYFLEQSVTKFNERTNRVLAEARLDNTKRGNTWNGRSKSKQFSLQKDSSMKFRHPPQHLALNPCEDSLVLATGSLLLWKSLNSNNELTWHVENVPTNTTVTSLQFITTSHETPILAGYSDGTVRLWHTTRQTSPLVSFRARDEPFPTNLHLGWQRHAERIVAAGEHTQLWDIRAERKIADLPSGCDLPVTSVTCSTTDSSFALGYRDGHSRIFDVRLPEVCISVIPAHRAGQAAVASSIRGEDSSLAVCLEGGAFCRIDRRYPERPLTSWQVDRESSLAAIHPTAPLVGFGGARGVCLYNVDGEVQSKLKMGHAATAMAFHQDQIQLIVGGGDGKVSLYSNRKNTL